MREIKFRAWHIENRFMFVPRRIDFPHFMIGDPAKWEVWYQYDDSDDSTPEHFPLMDISFYGDELELMQYTGLKDRNDKEIYEGDIVNVNDFTLPVLREIVFAWGGFSTSQNDVIMPPFQDMEIIGNIYENPELKEAAG